MWPGAIVLICEQARQFSTYAPAWLGTDFFSSKLPVISPSPLVKRPYATGGVTAETKDAAEAKDRSPALRSLHRAAWAYRRVVFVTDRDRLAYLETLQEFRQALGIKVDGYCLMTNHAHLIVEPAQML
jgi:Transposase IS200 like